MHTEFYERLGVLPTATQEEIKKAYRKMAIKWHPDKQKTDKDKAKDRFQKIAEAYDILSDPSKRKLYDKYGNGYDKEIESGQSFVDPFKIFDEIFKGGSLNSYGLDDDFDLDFEVPDNFTHKRSFFAQGNHNSGQTFVNMVRNTGGTNDFNIFNKKERYEVKTKADKLEKEILCSLQEVYKGCTKSVSYTKINGSKQVKAMVSVPISPGLKEGATIIYNGKGNSIVGKLPGDIEFVFKIKEHSVFKWVNDDLIMTKKISFYDALKGFTMSIETLDGTELNIKVPPLKNSSYEHICKGHGMPIRKDSINYGYGDLCIKFAIALPVGPIRKEILGLL